jgi:hypothetical protein
MITINNNEVKVITPAGFDKLNPLFSYNVAKRRLNFSDFQCDRITYVYNDSVEYKFTLNSNRNVQRLVNAVKHELEAAE